MLREEVYAAVLEIHLLAGRHPAAPPGPAPLARLLVGRCVVDAVLRASTPETRCFAVAQLLARWYLARGAPPSLDVDALALGLAVPLPALAICSRLLGYTVPQLARIFDVPEMIVRAALAEIGAPPGRSGEYVLDVRELAAASR